MYATTLLTLWARSIAHLIVTKQVATPPPMWFLKLNQHPPAHHPMDAHYYSVTWMNLN